MKYTLHLPAVNGGAFNCAPCGAFDLEADRILTNDIHIPCIDGSHPHSMRLWVIGNEYGPVGAVWASNEQEAMDELVDQDMAATFLISEEDQRKADEEERENWTSCGDAGEPCDLDNAWMRPVEFVGERDWKLIAKFTEARGNGSNNLDF